MKLQYIGSSESRLLAVHHAPRSIDSDRAVLICSPLGQEYIRTHWALRMLANQLSRRGIHVVRFDYRGHGDSFGDIQDVRSIEQWKDDVAVAADFLKQESGVPNVMLVGLRAGAALATEVASERSDIHSIVAWEAIFRGEDYLNELRQVHANMIDLWFQKVFTDNNDRYEEILGWRFQRRLIDEIQSWNLNFDSLEIPHLIVSLENQIPIAPEKRNRLQKRLQVDDESVWGKLSGLENAWLRPNTTQLIVKTIDDMFKRLGERGMLMARGELASTGSCR